MLEVLTKEGGLLNEMWYKGPCPPLKILQQFMLSQTELQRVFFSGGPQCICGDHGERGRWQALRATSRNMGMFWIPILRILLKNHSVTDIDCRCCK